MNESTTSLINLIDTDWSGPHRKIFAPVGFEAACTVDGLHQCSKPFTSLSSQRRIDCTPAWISHRTKSLDTPKACVDTSLPVAHL